MRAEGRINNSRPIRECVFVNEKLIEFIRTAAETSQGIASGRGSALCPCSVCSNAKQFSNNCCSRMANDVLTSSSLSWVDVAFPLGFLHITELCVGWNPLD
ncbi:uncharacterized protein LOC122756518 [Drosophila santomea]|uniref:uncharacterized protein LOC122756518 n=1 Tax=Drosophila santomea TaxID=129105 RepID=UPI001CCDF175|nr:uncharacterized protein LOC122756518 [Drosophila santomea]